MYSLSISLFFFFSSKYLNLWTNESPCPFQQCKIEWFHFGCVGLKEQPKGKWYCSDCAALKNRRKGRWCWKAIRGPAVFCICTPLPNCEIEFFTGDVYLTLFIYLFIFAIAAYSIFLDSFGLVLVCDSSFVSFKRTYTGAWR